MLQRLSFPLRHLCFASGMRTRLCFNSAIRHSTLLRRRQLLAPQRPVHRVTTGKSSTSQGI
ncbi:hypothetical protein CLIM01_15010 [Colletotrichum limetticola]|uniref:Uncharacterized protein n=1 Tax=Colletotrichum limetticola TaxID=1209924 RepID=A0ABQ9P937_9PEZI|nr:hypothetical protein CLIM01_15010 [Colletotrichum limetticola]